MSVRLTAAQNNLWADSSKLGRPGDLCQCTAAAVLLILEVGDCQTSSSYRHHPGEDPGSASLILDVGG